MYMYIVHVHVYLLCVYVYTYVYYSLYFLSLAVKQYYILVLVQKADVSSCHRLSDDPGTLTLYGPAHVRQEATVCGGYLLDTCTVVS